MTYTFGTNVPRRAWLRLWNFPTHKHFNSANVLLTDGSVTNICVARYDGVIVYSRELACFSWSTRDDIYVGVSNYLPE